MMMNVMSAVASGWTVPIDCIRTQSGWTKPSSMQQTMGAIGPASEVMGSSNSFSPPSSRSQRQLPAPGVSSEGAGRELFNEDEAVRQSDGFVLCERREALLWKTAEFVLRHVSGHISDQFIAHREM